MFQGARSEANYFLSLIETLTYRQLCILSLIYQINDYELRSQPWPPGANVDPESFHTSLQALNLYQRQLVVSFNNERGRGANVYEPSLLIPSQAIISGTGARLSGLLELHKIPKKELREIAEKW